MIKKYIQYCLIAGLTVFASCLSEEEDLFSESAAWRLNNAIENARSVLVSPDNNNGWVMEYFPNNYTEGYTFLIKFDNHSFATVAAKNKYTPVYTTDAGAFDVIGDNGPVLTFNTYNKVFHLFSNPEDPKGGSGMDGIGIGGDYEFIIMDVTADLVRLKGKKRETGILMRPLARGQDWEGYFEKLDQMDASIFNPKLPVTLTLKSNEEADPYFLTDGATHIFTARTQSEIDDEDQGQNIPFIITDYGLRFSQPFDLSGDSVQAFRLSDDKSKLICVDKDVQAEITGEELSSIFLNAHTVLWAFDPSALSERVASVYDRIVKSCIAVYQAEEVIVGIGYSIARSSYELRLSIVRNSGRQTLSGNLSLSAAQTGQGVVSFQATGAGDSNGIVFSNNIDGYKEMAELVSTSFLLSSDTPINPANMKFMQVGGTEVWFLTTCQ